MDASGHAWHKYFDTDSGQAYYVCVSCKVN